MSRNRVALIVGARPNFMKAAPLMRQLQSRPQHFEPLLIHTGQHYDHKLSQVFFDELNLPRPDHYLGIGSDTHAIQTARIMIALEKTLCETKPNLVLVFGDVNSTLATAVVTSKLQLPLAHVEAGLRSFDNSMPEEINRIVTDRLSDYLFVSEEVGIKNLKDEGTPDDKVFLSGNIMIDTLIDHLQVAGKSDALERLELLPQEYIVMTMHRPANVDDPARLQNLIGCAQEASRWLPVIFPCHPRTARNIENFKLAVDSKGSDLRVIEPLGYLDFLRLQSQARLVLTDSGGVQEETTYLKIPCITLRDTTELVATVEVGTNVLCGTDRNKIMTEVERVRSGNSKVGAIPELWDGHTAERIATTLQNIL